MGRRLGMLPRRVPIALGLVVVTALGGCGQLHSALPTVPYIDATTLATLPASPAEAAGTTDVYEHTRAGDMSAAVAGIPSRVYVPNSESNTVDVIDPATLQIVDHFPVGRHPQHITPAWDMQTLYADNDEGNTLTPIDPRTGKPAADLPVEDPYNLYYTPDGTKAVVVAERFKRLDFRDPKTWQLIKSVPVPYRGVDHADFNGDGTAMVASCEFSGWIVQVDLQRLEVSAALHVGGAPIDVKLSPDGQHFFVANQDRNGVSVIDARTFRETKFVKTGAGAHGMYFSRDGRVLYVSNRKEGSVSVMSVKSMDVIDTWKVGGSPDMGGVTADGKQLWLSGRYNQKVYVIDTTDGKLLKTFDVGKGPHGLAIFPQPGRFSLGHTGVFR
jgi:YVTN family beta-propeller protein